MEMRCFRAQAQKQVDKCEIYLRSLVIIIFHQNMIYVLFLLSIILMYLYRSEYSAFWKCVQAGGAYMFTQLCKMLLLATFFPMSEVPAGGFDVVGVIVVFHILK